MGTFSCNKHLNFKENMWKPKLKVCLINFLVYSLCTFLLYLCFHWQALHRQDFGPTAIGYVYKQEGENSGLSPFIVSLPDPLRFELQVTVQPNDIGEDHIVSVGIMSGNHKYQNGYFLFEQSGNEINNITHNKFICLLNN